MLEVKVGVVGYCPPTQFDVVEAQRHIVTAFDELEQYYPNRSITIVSGLTNVGVLAIAYAEAVKRGWRTVGITSKRALEHPLFPVDEQHIVGENWGDESDTFLELIEAIVRIGGGPQSHNEAAACKIAGKPTFEYELARL